MSYFKEEDIQKIESELLTIKGRYLNLVSKILKLSERLNEDKAKEYLLHGVARRLDVIERCVENVYSIFPPQRKELLSRDELKDVDINLHAFVVNVFGILDNLAWVLVHEKTGPLDATAEQYCKRADVFLKDVFYNKEKVSSNLVFDFETVNWYHTLLPVKLHRALCGFHEPVNEDEFALYDAVAQFAICKKAIDESVKALRRIEPYYPSHKNLIIELLALLHNILSRIEAMEESI